MSRSIKIIMLGLAFIFAGLAFVTVEKPKNKTESNTYQVAKVIDGDTLEVNRYGKLEKVRLIGIDTPETLDPRKPVQCFGKEASNKSKDLLTGKNVKLEFDPVVGEKDKYGRTLAYVWQDGTLINLKLLKEGYAHEYTYRNQSYKYQGEFKSAQADAKNSQVGLWSSQTCNGVTR